MQLGNPPPSVIQPDALHTDKFWQYIYERQAIWFRRFIDLKPPVWTLDPVLQKYSFTNAYRELDRGTVFYVEKLMKDFPTFTDQVAASIAYRHFNRIDTWRTCFERNFQGVATTNEGWDNILENLWNMNAEVGSVFTGAFMVTGSNVPENTTKFEYILGQVRRNVMNRAADIAGKFRSWSSPAGLHRELTTLEGIGPFLAYEIYSDLMYTGSTIVQENDWANPGPGAQKGLELLFPGQRNHVELMIQLQRNQINSFHRLGLAFEHVALKDENNETHWLTMRNIEHNLCEYSKFARGKARSKFVAHSGTDLYAGVV